MTINDDDDDDDDSQGLTFTQNGGCTLLTDLLPKTTKPRLQET